MRRSPMAVAASAKTRREEMPVEKETQNGTYALPLFLSGAVIGAALGVLFAPDSGKETRRKLGQWLREKREKAKGEVLAKREQVTAALEAGKRAYKESEKKLVGV